MYVDPSLLTNTLTRYLKKMTTQMPTPLVKRLRQPEGKPNNPNPPSSSDSTFACPIPTPASSAVSWRANTATSQCSTGQASVGALHVPNPATPVGGPAALAPVDALAYAIPRTSNTKRSGRITLAVSVLYEKLITIMRLASRRTPTTLVLPDGVAGVSLRQRMGKVGNR